MRLRAVENNDLKMIHTLFNDKRVTDYWFMESTIPMEIIEKKYEEDIKDPTCKIFTIDVDGAFAGIVGFEDIDHRHRHAEIEIALSNDFAGKGIAQKAFSECVKYGFETLNLHKIYLYVDSENKAAIHIYEKNKFVSEGTLKDEYYVGGKYRDAIFMGLINK